VGLEAVDEVYKGEIPMNEHDQQCDFIINETGILRA
jgi:5-formyltetrahydrofolate cyclo-ligase